MFVVPDDGRPLQDVVDILQGFDRDVLANDFVTRPHDVDVRGQLGTNRVQVFRVSDRGQCPRCAVLGRAEQEFALAKMLPQSEEKKNESMNG